MTTSMTATAAPGIDPAALTERIREKSLVVGGLLTEIRKVIVGQNTLVERLVIGLLADGHLLLEGVPGLAKTLAVKTLARGLDASFARVQFTPDLLPADLVGTLVFNPKTQEFVARRGPIFAQPPPRRRDQPGAREGPVRAPRGDAGAAGHGRRHDAPRSRTRSSSSRRRTRSSRKERIRSPRRRSTASS